MRLVELPLDMIAGRLHVTMPMMHVVSRLAFTSIAPSLILIAVFPWVIRLSIRIKHDRYRDQNKAVLYG